MQPEKSSRMDIGELKAQLSKKVGQERFKRYFHCLNRFINQKLSKSEFDKSCYRILGRENLPLHNQIIKAILKNASSAKTPPSQVREVGPASNAVLEDGYGQGPLIGHHQSSVAPIWSNGVVPMSPRKGKSTIRDRKLRDRPSPLGPNGKVDSNSYQLENGDLAPCDYQRPLYQSQGLAEQPETDSKFVIKKSSDASFVVRGDIQNNATVVEDGEGVEHANQLKFPKNPLNAPLGIPFCSASIGGARKTLPVTHVGDYVSCFDLGGLSDSETIRRQMEHTAAQQGIEVTLECANTLNNMVDVYLKRLIRSCLELVGSRSASDTSAYPVQKQQIPGKPINGVWPSNHLHLQNNSGARIESNLEPCNTGFNQSVSLLDFKVAMKLNPQQLGENWPLLLEKISMQGFEE